MPPPQSGPPWEGPGGELGAGCLTDARSAPRKCRLSGAAGISAAEDGCGLAPRQRACCQQPRAEPIPLPGPPAEDVGRGIDVGRPGILRDVHVLQPPQVISGRLPGRVSGNVLQGDVRGVPAEIACGLGPAGPDPPGLPAAAGFRAITRSKGATVTRSMWAPSRAMPPGPSRRHDARASPPPGRTTARYSKRDPRQRHSCPLSTGLLVAWLPTALTQANARGC
jgi:hypothetical protein